MDYTHFLSTQGIGEVPWSLVDLSTPLKLSTPRKYAQLSKISLKIQNGTLPWWNISGLCVLYHVVILDLRDAACHL